MWMLQAQCRRPSLGVVGVGCGSVVGVADLEITLILGRVGRRAQACSLVVLVTAAEGHAGVRVLAVSVRPNRHPRAPLWRVGGNSERCRGVGLQRTHRPRHSLYSHITGCSLHSTPDTAIDTLYYPNPLIRQLKTGP